MIICERITATERSPKLYKRPFEQTFINLGLHGRARRYERRRKALEQAWRNQSTYTDLAPPAFNDKRKINIEAFTPKGVQWINRLRESTSSKEAKIFIGAQALCFAAPYVLSQFSAIYASSSAMALISTIPIIPIAGLFLYGAFKLLKRRILLMEKKSHLTRIPSKRPKGQKSGSTRPRRNVHEAPHLSPELHQLPPGHQKKKGKVILSLDRPISQKHQLLPYFLRAIYSRKDDLGRWIKDPSILNPKWEVNYNFGIHPSEDDEYTATLSNVGPWTGQEVLSTPLGGLIIEVSLKGKRSTELKPEEWVRPQVPKDISGEKGEIEFKLIFPRQSFPIQKKITNYGEVLANLEEIKEELYRIFTQVQVPFEDLPHKAQKMIIEARELSLDKAVATIEGFVSDNYKYDPNFRKSPEYQRFAMSGDLRNYFLWIHSMAVSGKLGRGMCTEIAEVTIELLRHAGIPAVLASGISLEPGKTKATDEDLHDWAIALLPDEEFRQLSWYTIDPSPNL